ncbi:MAG TPA: CHAP domain-containing protein, partial [Ktedonobacteraceae bacterium]
MSSNKKQPRSVTEGLQIPGLVENQEPVEQLSFTVNPQTPMPLAAPISQSGELDLADEQTAPRLRARAGVAEMDIQLPSPSSTGYANGPGSLAGMEDMYTLERPISQMGIADSPLPRQNSSAPVGVPSSLAGLENLDSALAGIGMPVATRATTRALPDSQPGITRALAGTRPEPGTTASRPPMVIRGSSGSRTRSARPPQGRRHVISIATLVVLALFTVGMLFMVSPLGRDVRANLAGQGQGPKVIQNAPQGNMSLVAQATATAVVHQQNDGVDPGASGGGATLGNTSGSLSWPYGYCTYWANLHYHALSGHWVAWHGNADQWVAGARLAGWHVSQSPHVPSILVLMDGVQGASYVGHVAVVFGISGNVVHTSNMNWYANGGGFGIVSNYDF